MKKKGEVEYVYIYCALFRLFVLSYNRFLLSREVCKEKKAIALYKFLLFFLLLYILLCEIVMMENHFW